MDDIRCDLLSDNYMSFEIEHGLLKVDIHNGSLGLEETMASIYLSQENTATLIKGLAKELNNIAQVGESPTL